jgi:hypothetical protein
MYVVGRFAGRCGTNSTQRTTHRLNHGADFDNAHRYQQMMPQVTGQPWDSVGSHDARNARMLTRSRGAVAMEKLRIGYVTLGSARGDRKWPLNDGGIPNFLGVREHASAGYNRVEGNRGMQVSVLAGAQDPRVVSLCLVDPVDNTVYAPLAPGYPSAVRA